MLHRGFILKWQVKIILPIPCRPNCDNSTVAPFLNINDFLCFQSRFASGDSYANCDGSPLPPVLTINDFVCFQAAFAAGAPNADCDHSGSLNVNDFVCFQGAFAAGCSSL